MLVFVTAVMTSSSVLDYGFGKLVLWVFGGSCVDAAGAGAPSVRRPPEPPTARTAATYPRK